MRACIIRSCFPPFSSHPLCSSHTGLLKHAKHILPSWLCNCCSLHLEFSSHRCPEGSYHHFLSACSNIITSESTFYRIVPAHHHFTSPPLVSFPIILITTRHIAFLLLFTSRSHTLTSVHKLHGNQVLFLLFSTKSPVPKTVPVT